MSRGKASGYTLKSSDVSIIHGMVARGDRDHDIAAWFGVNQGRIAEAKEGKYGPGQPAGGSVLPPRGLPELKADAYAGLWTKRWAYSPQKKRLGLLRRSQCLRKHNPNTTQMKPS